MSEPTTLPPWTALAGMALRASAREQHTLARQHVQKIAERYGPDVIPRVLLAMVDTVLARASHTPDGTAVRVAWMQAETGHVQTADEVPPAIRWAGRFFAARAADDQTQAEALLDSIRSAEEWGACASAVINVCGTQLRLMGADL